MHTRDMSIIYKRPEILQEIRTETEKAFLLASVVDNLAPVESTGQEVKEYNFADKTSFNHEWE